MKKPSAGLVVAVIALVVALGSGAYAASGLITHDQLAPNSVWHNNIGNESVRTDNLQDQAVGHTKLKPNSVWHKNIGTGSVQKGNLSADIQNQLAQHGATGPRGPVGPAGPQGASGLTGAFYSVQQYAGAVGGGAIATVACDPNNDTTSQKYVAISGGVQDADNSTDMTVNTGQLPVAASFPGRMNFTTFTPKPGRLDGWIIQFGHLGTSDTNISVWALCAPVSVPLITHPATPASQ